MVPGSSNHLNSVPTTAGQAATSLFASTASSRWEMAESEAPRRGVWDTFNKKIQIIFFENAFCKKT